MKNIYLKLLVVVTLFSPFFSAVTYAADQITRTPWQMNPGKGHAPLVTTGFGTEDNYKLAVIPVKDDPNWKDAPNTETIGFGGSKESILPPGCQKNVDYTYFQTFVHVPPGATVSEFKIIFDGEMDDGSRITVFNEGDTSGQLVPDSYVKIGGKGTKDLASLMKEGENRVVITQVDVCPAGNTLESAKVELNGKVVEAAAPESCEVRGRAWGDVHMVTVDGLKYDFQSAGDFTLLNANDGNIKIESRQIKYPRNPKVAVNGAIALWVGGDEIEIHIHENGEYLSSPAMYLNNQEAELPGALQGLPAGGFMRPGEDANQFLFFWPNNEFCAVVDITPGSHMDVGVPNVKLSKASGLLGNFDGDSKNDMTMQTGEEIVVTEQYKEIKEINRFGGSWGIAGGGGMLRGTIPVQHADTSTTIDDLTDDQRKLGTETCAAAGVEAPHAKNGCILDVGSTGEKRFARSAKKASDTELKAKDEGTISVAGDKPSSLAGRNSGGGTGLEIDSSSEEPTITAACLGGEAITLTGVTVSESGQLQVYDGPSDFHYICENLALASDGEDITLSGSCANSDANLIATTLSLADVPSMQPLFATEACQSKTTETVTSTTTPGGGSSEIEVQLEGIACKPVDERTGAEVDLRQELENLQGVPFVALYCAVHQNGQTWRSYGGFTAEQAQAEARTECELLAEADVADKGPVTSPCALWGMAKRSLSLGGSMGGSVIRKHVTPIEAELVTPDRKPPDVAVTVPPGQPPQITSSCLQGVSLPLYGITTNDLGELMFHDGPSDFQQNCINVRLDDSAEDLLLSARCNTASGTQVDASISLLGSQALADMLNYQSCVDEPLMCSAEGPNPLLFPPVTLEPVMTHFTEAGLQVDMPEGGDFLLIRSADEQVVVYGRRELWSADASHSVITAVFIQVGPDTVEIVATPEGDIRVNSEQPEADEALDLPGGGRVEALSHDVIAISWPDTSFQAEVRVFPGSHLVPAFKPDPEMTYEGLVRFTERWILDPEVSPFTHQAPAAPDCNCGDDSRG